MQNIVGFICKLVSWNSVYIWKNPSHDYKDLLVVDN